MKHICNICGREIDCNVKDCDYPETYPMNCGVDKGNPIHQEEYIKATRLGN